MVSKPQDHKAGADEPFVFESSVGTITLPPFKVKSGFLRKNRHKDELDLMYTLLETLAPEAVVEQTDELDQDELGQLFEGWQEQSGVSLGES